MLISVNIFYIQDWRSVLLNKHEASTYIRRSNCFAKVKTVLVEHFIDPEIVSNLANIFFERDLSFSDHISYCRQQILSVVVTYSNSRLVELRRPF